MRRLLGYAYDPAPVATTGALARWQRLPGWRQRAIMAAVAAGEMTQREIAREFGCSLTLVGIARALGA